MKLFVIGWAVFLPSLAACTGAQPQVAEKVMPETASGAEPAMSAEQRFVPVRAPEGVHALEAAGRLLAPPNAHAEITLPLAASVLHVSVNEGQRVERGDVIADVAMPEAARAAGRVEGARLRIDAYRERLAHLDALRSEGLARGSEVADARARLAEAQADEHEALAMLQTVESVGLRRRGNRYEVTAPLSGVVVQVDAPIGSVRGPSDKPIVRITGGAPTRIEARFAFPLPADAAYELIDVSGRATPVFLVAQAPEVMVGDAARVAWFDAKTPLLSPQGSAVRVRMVPASGGFVVPSAALIKQAGGFVVRTRRAGNVEVALLVSLGGEALVRGALTADDVVAEQRSAP